MFKSTNINTLKKKQKKNKKMKFKKYTIDFKLKIIPLIPLLGYYGVSKIYGIDRKSLREWKKRKNELEKIKNKENSFRLPGGGTKIKNPEIENQISKFLLRCNEIGIPINTGMIIDELIRIEPNMKFKERSSLRKWCYRFLGRFKSNQLS